MGAVWSLNGPKQTLTSVASNAVPVIAAKPGPLKEKPTEPGGLEIPNQKANVLEKLREDPKAPQKVLAREEQPVDLSQAAKKDVRRVDLGQSGPTGAAPVNIVAVPTAPVSPLPPAPNPPKVEVSAIAPVVVPQIKPAEAPAKPDLSSLSASPAGNTPPAAKPATVVSSVDPVGASSSSVPKRVKSIRINSSGDPVDAPPASGTAASAPSQPPAAPPKVVSAAKTPAPVAKVPTKQALAAKDTTTPPAGVGDDAAPLQIVPPAGVSRKGSQTPSKAAQRVAAAPVPATDDTTNAIAGQSSVPSSTASAGGKGFSVQFGAPGSTGEANALISKLKSQYPSVMGSVEPRVIKADVNGKSFYRVRSGSVSRDQATTICSELKAAGGNCFISGG